MNMKKQLRQFIQNRKKEIQKGVEITEQQRAERLRKRAGKISDMKPSTKKTIVSGLVSHSGLVDVMKEEYSRRKYNRKQKHKS